MRTKEMTFLRGKSPKYCRNPQGRHQFGARKGLLEKMLLELVVQRMGSRSPDGERGEGYSRQREQHMQRP